MDGWIKLHRKMLDWEWYDDINTKAVFIDLLLNANYEEHCWHGQKITKGACVTSYPSIAKRNKLTIQEVRTAIKKLEKTGEINRQTTNRNTLVIVCNYAKYQDIVAFNYTEFQQTSNSQATDKQQTSNTIQEGKKERNKEINNIYKSASHSNIAKLYNSICKDLPKVKVINNARRERIDKFLKLLDVYNATAERYFERIQQSDFLTGRNGRANGSFNFDWVISSDNVIAVCEGKYDNRKKKQDKLQRKASYDIEEIKHNAMENTDI